MQANMHKKPQTVCVCVYVFSLLAKLTIATAFMQKQITQMQITCKQVHMQY